MISSKNGEYRNVLILFWCITMILTACSDLFRIYARISCHFSGLPGEATDNLNRYVGLDNLTKKTAEEWLWLDASTKECQYHNKLIFFIVWTILLNLKLYSYKIILIDYLSMLLKRMGTSAKSMACLTMFGRIYFAC